ncbi:MAG TPA: Ig-like domain-containing protein, partial [Nitrososphaera sp.]
MIQGILAQNPDARSSQETVYSVRILPPATNTIKEKESKDQQIDYTVQITRENKKGQFVATLSTVSDTPALNLLRSFTPSFTVNMEEGVTALNTTLTIPGPRADSLTPGNYKFQVQAVNLRSNDLTSNQIRTPVQALSNIAILQVVDDKLNSELASSQSKVQASQTPAAGSPSAAADQQQQEQQQQIAPGQQQQPPKPNHPPIARAGPNHQVNEGDIVILDASTSSDADRGQTLSYLWEQASPKIPSLKIEQPSANSPKAKFTAPQIKEGDDPLRFTVKLTVQDGNGGQASDTLSVAVMNKKQTGNLEGDNKATPSNSPNEIPSATPSSEGKVQGQEPDSTTPQKNRPPTAQSVSASTQLDKSLSISLQGSDPDNADKITFSISRGPTDATIAGFDKATGTFTYVPEAGFTGKDSIKYKVVDSNGAESNEASVTIKVGHSSSSSIAAKDSISGSKGNGSATATAATATTTSTVEDRLKQREELAAKIRETRGEKITNQYIVVLKKY